jgi:starvation-inducible DNA-binding protein
MKNNQEIAKILNKLLTESLNTTLQAKHYHWNVRGIHFISYHKLFDEIFENLLKQNDIIAERISSLDQHVFAAVNPTFPETPVKDLEFVEKLEHSLATFSENIKTGIGKITELGDKVTADILSMIAAVVDKYSWFLRAHLEKPL